MTLISKTTQNSAKVRKGFSKSVQLLGAASLVALMATVMTPVTATAQANQEDTYSGGKSRVNNSSRLRSLSHSMVGAGCRLAAGIETDTAIEELRASQATYNTILDGLENGSPALGMPTAEKSSVVLRSIWSLQELWIPMDGAITEMLGGNLGGVETLASGHTALYDQAAILASDISGQYSDPQELLQADAITFNFLGRQLALASQMALEVCELATDGSDAETQADLQQSASLFEASLNALIQGFPSAGVSPPPNDAIKTSLESISAMWNANKAVFEKAIAGAALDANDVTVAANTVDELAVALNNTVTLYLIASPGQSGVYRVPLEAYARGELASWLENPELIAAIRAQNAEHDGLSEDEVIALDQQWRGEAGSGGGPLISKLLGHPVSTWLMSQQAGTAGFVTEVFVMDNLGLNVAQSAQTSDYWQGDEAKWKQSFGNGPGALHIGDVEFDDSTGFYQSQASLAITDPDSGEVIGAVTFGVNVQSLM